jgi:23S rRNA-/tRNA-specific pseudouridylate synthase
MVQVYLELFPAGEGLGRGGLESGILHRLDTGTSGCLVFAKTQIAFERIHAAWKTHEVLKIYRALSRPALDTPPTLPLPEPIDLAIGHDIKSKRRMRVISAEWSPHQLKTRIRGKPLPALTRVLEHRTLKQGVHELTVAIDTGVMHQIRVHLAHFGLPLLGDPVYGGSPSRRLGLHAWKVRLPSLSSTGLPLDITAPLPEFWPLS